MVVFKFKSIPWCGFLWGRGLNAWPETSTASRTRRVDGFIFSWIFRFDDAHCFWFSTDTIYMINRVRKHFKVDPGIVEFFFESVNKVQQLLICLISPREVIPKRQIQWLDLKLLSSWDRCSAWGIPARNDNFFAMNNSSRSTETRRFPLICSISLFCWSFTETRFSHIISESSSSWNFPVELCLFILLCVYPGQPCCMAWTVLGVSTTMQPHHHLHPQWWECKSTMYWQTRWLWINYSRTGMHPWLVQSLDSVCWWSGKGVGLFA